MVDLNNCEFTFYGDLLGISNLYSIDQKLAKETLSKFYNSIYDEFKGMNEPDAKVYLFSDSLFITGKDLKTVLLKLGKVYTDLFYKNILIKGAMVGGKLDFDPRIELANIEKRLPSSDVLHRAVGIQKNIKGMRLLFEKKLAKKILPVEWLTDEKYEKNINFGNYDENDFRRHIVLAREWTAFEYLWIISLDKDYQDKAIVTNINNVFDNKMNKVPSEVIVHFKETQNMFSRASERYLITKKQYNKK